MKFVEMIPSAFFSVRMNNGEFGFMKSAIMEFAFRK